MKNKSKLLWLGSFFLPFLLLLLVWMTLQLAPFGDNNLLVSDLGTQYMPFLSFLKRSFHEGITTFYSFSNEIGESIVPLAAYYLLSPFNVLAFFFPYEQLPIAILWIITLKLALMGTTMFSYLKYTYQKVDGTTLLFSTSYSFCGFVTVYSQNFMWLDALILFPLILLGLQRLWDQRKWGLYSITLFLAIVTNYYMGYMICLFAVLYSIYWFFKKNTQAHAIRQFFKQSPLFILVSFLTGTATSFLLLPAAEGMLYTKKADFDVSTFFLTPKFNTSFFSQLGLGSINYELRLDHLPTVFAGLFVTLLCVAYFQTKQIALKERIASAILLFILFLSFWLEAFNTVWHMFQSPAGFPYRNVFIFSFLLIVFAYEVWLKKVTIPWTAPIIFSLLLVIGYGSLYYGPQKNLLISINYLWLSLLFIWLIFFCLRLAHKKALRNYVVVALFLLVSTELTTNFWISFKHMPFGSQATFAQDYRKHSQLIDEKMASAPELYRMKQVIPSKETGFREINNGYNNPLLYGYAGVSSYTSTLTATTQDTLSALGLYRKNDRRIAYVDNSQLTNLLLNVKYDFLPIEKPTSEKLLKTVGSTKIMENDEAIGMSFLAPTALTKLKLAKNNPLDAQEELLQTLVPTDKPYFKTASLINEPHHTNETIEATFKVNSTGDLHLYIPNLKWKKVTQLKVNQQVISTPIYIATNQLFNLGHFEKGTTVTLSLTAEQVVDLTNWQLQTLDQTAFNRAVDKLRQQALHVNATKKGHLNGALNVPGNDTQLLYTSIPYDQDWQVKSSLQKEPLKTQRILGGFLAVEVPAGKQQLTFAYHPRMIYLGTAVSGTILLGTAGYLGFKKYRRKRQEATHD